MHNLTGLLEAAIRATNAQFDDPESLKRLDCRLLEVWARIRVVLKPDRFCYESFYDLLILLLLGTV